MLHLRCFVILCFVSICFGRSVESRLMNNRPIIGVLAQELDESMAGKFGNHSSYIAASYVKYLEGAGARVVPIMIGKSRLHYTRLLKNLNAVLFPGGDADFEDPNGYADAADIIFKYAMKMNDQGDYFPLWGTCLGFELITYLAADRQEHRADCSSQDQMIPLEFAPDFLKSRMFAKAPKSIIDILSTKNVAPNFHHFCVTEKNMTKYGLTEEWQILATNHDFNGFEFVSAIESTIYPFYAIMFHPEKIGYEWKETKPTPHDFEAIQTMQYFADFFVNEARKNQHKYTTIKQERKALIYSQKVVYTGNNSSFEQIYFFN